MRFRAIQIDQRSSRDGFYYGVEQEFDILPCE